jgi:uncharacterized protein
VSRVRQWVWWSGAPARVALIALIRAYRVTLGGLVGGQCRFFPSCSEYAEQAIRSVGATRGTMLAVWRIARCSPLSAGGIDHPPLPRYEGNIHKGGAPW